MDKGGPEFLKLVDSKAHKPKRVYAGTPIECRCGSRTSIEVRINRTLKNGKVTAGKKSYRCADCGQPLL